MSFVNKIKNILEKADMEYDQKSMEKCVEFLYERGIIKNKENIIKEIKENS